MGTTIMTLVVLFVFFAVLGLITYRASRSNKATPDDFFLANRGLGTVVLLMTTGASFFSTWTLLGAIGSYYREGVWFIAFAAWTVVHALFIWLFGARIWQLGRQFGFVTPGELVERYYGSPLLRTLFAVVGIVCLVPVMLIQVTGGAGALTSLTEGAVPYWVGVTLMGVFVGAMVAISGGRGAAWGDTFMGVFFGTVLLLITLVFVFGSGGFDSFRNISEVSPEVLVNQGNFWGIFDTALGLGLAFWVMPHMWQKFYSARSPLVLAKTSLLTPFWNSWLMALGALTIGILAHYPGLVPGLSADNSDQTIPLFFAAHAPLLGSIVIAAIIAAAISTINSQLLTSANILTTDLYKRFVNPGLTMRGEAYVGRIAVGGLTIMVVVLAFTPAAQGFLVPLSSLGFAIAIQMCPAAFGALMWRGATRLGAITSLIAGLSALTLVYLVDSPLPMGPAASGIITGSVVFVVVSLLDPRGPTPIQHEFHDSLIKKLYTNRNSADKTYAEKS
ncbi:sodium:solute symporter family protein [Nesterenkonia jeotgali]|uniref:SSS family solute:Na+ symporter n=1 Tax=Nesterenkonia jeotgali TaxID=317018 RepID=A0A839FHV7_9MICC|nr:sodium:solute symporter family protein [Nesterenkonia jeotgali]MBA8921358.1 SSS family solute:Na+ symporter [Nesterenkonia jeotgali]